MRYKILHAPCGTHLFNYEADAPPTPATFDDNKVRTISGAAMKQRGMFAFGCTTCDATVMDVEQFVPAP